MATPIVLDPQDYLAPIAGDSPSGRDLAYEPEYDALREARRSEDDAPQGDWQRKAKVADWDEVIALGTEILRRRSKDLQVAAWIAEALAQRYGLAGVRDGLRLVLAIQEAFWDSYYPRVEDGDLDSRSGPFVLLNNALPLIIRSVPLTAGYGAEHYSFLRWQESRATDNVGLKNPDLMAALVAEGKITSQQFDDEAAQTPRKFYETLVDDLREATEALKALNQSNDTRFGGDAPGLVNLRKAFDDLRKPLDPLLAVKRAAEPDPEPEPGKAEPSEVAPAEPDEDDEAPTPAPRRKKAAPPRSSGGPIASVEDAAQRIAEAAAYLRQHAPASPVPFLVVRALRMGELYGMSAPPEVAAAEAPSSEARQALRTLAAGEQWEELLEQAEQALARPEGRAWLDPQRYALTAMNALGDPDRTAASAAVTGLLRAVLADYPGLPDAELADGTPTANAETRAWIGATVRAHAPEPAASEPQPSLERFAEEAPAGADAPPDIWEQAVTLVQRGRTPEGIQLVRRAVQDAATGRERFLRKLQLAELCLMVNHHRVALPVAEDLARQVDEYRLEQWEDEQLSARAWGVLYRCLRASAGADNGTADRLKEVFTRLCRLDIGQALQYADDRAP